VLLVVIFLMALLVITLLSQARGSSSYQIIEEYLHRSGPLGPLFYVVLLLFLGIISIIPAAPLVIASGFLFGTFYGALYTFIGYTLSDSAMFFFARRAGKDIALSLFDKKEVNHFVAFFKKRGTSALLLARCIPLFPGTIVSFFCGTSKMTYNKFFITTAIILVPMILLQTFFGDILSTIHTHPTLGFVFLGIFLGAGGFIFLYRHQLKRFFFKELKAIE